LKKPLHILYLARWYPHKFDNMYGLFVKRHAEAAAIKHRISVFYVHACDELPHKHETEVKKGFINEYFYYFRKAKTSIGFLNTIINAYRFLNGHRVLRRKIAKPNLIHVHILTRLGVIAYIANRISNIPYVITEHWSRYQEGNRGYNGILRKALTKLVTANASAFTTVTMDLKDAMEVHKIKNPKHYILNNVVDTKTFFPENKAYKNSDAIKLMHVSCFDDEPKNISGLLQCIKELSTKRNDFIVEMIGTGKDYDKIVNLTKELGLFETKVFFKGQLEGRQLGDAVRSADILMLFSNYENLPVVINEAFCCGVPVISTNVGGISEVVNDSNGRLVKKGDTSSFVHELIYMMDHLKDYDQQQIKKDAVAQYSVVAISEKLDEIYSKNTFY
jgi:glycosyltransferase involved in cell wall biosynthesis